MMYSQGGSAHLTGTHFMPYVVGFLSEEEQQRREQLRLNWTYMLDTAIDNLHKCLWFGILEDLDRSLEMLR